MTSLPITAPPKVYDPKTSPSSSSSESFDEVPLPDKRPRAKRLFSLPSFSPYRRLLCLVLLVNLIIHILLGTLSDTSLLLNPAPLIHIVLANITVTVLVRQQRLINLFFRLAVFSRTSLPLPVRWALAKVYHFGGVHSGAAISATISLLLFTVFLTRLRVLAVSPVFLPSVSLLVLTYLVILLLLLIILLALPPLRARFHNSFELSHRFLGWTVLLLVWPHSVLLSRDTNPDSSLITTYFSSPAPYLLFLITLSVASTWMTLRKVSVKIEKPSSHAIIVTFPSHVHRVFPGSSSAISLSPLKEWHSFANIPTPNDRSFRLVISRAGDWTSSVIDSPPTSFWLRGIPTAGVANIETLFHSIQYVATGSGIGPVMPHLLEKRVAVNLFWSARSPRETYGDAFVNEIMKACPNAVIWDTTEKGKPDMVKCVYHQVVDSAAEAVICISNQKLTRKVVYGMEARGIPAFGAIWDS